MNTLGSVSLKVVVRQPLCSTLAEQQPNLSFTGKQNKQGLRERTSLSEWKSAPSQKGNDNL